MALRRLAQASAWRVALVGANAATVASFEVWRANDANAAAMEQVERAWSRVGEAATAPEMLAWRAGALARAGRGGGPDNFGRRSWQRGRVATAASLAVVMLAGIEVWRASTPTTYVTGRGEQRTFLLGDGSRIALDADSELSVRLRPHARDLDLVRGQARFDVAHDTARPFTVHAGGREVVATGTSFDVDLLNGQVRVVLIEGRVRVLTDPVAPLTGRAPAPRLVATLAPGQQLDEHRPANTQIVAVDPSRAVAWQSGQLVFDDEPLASAAARIERYTARSFIVAPDVAALRVSGVFKITDADRFGSALERVLPIIVTRNADGNIVLKRRVNESSS